MMRLNPFVEEQSCIRVNVLNGGRALSIAMQRNFQGFGKYIDGNVFLSVCGLNASVD